jgi:uncharacterized protein YndB with AHSA1/START domain
MVMSMITSRCTLNSVVDEVAMNTITESHTGMSAGQELVITLTFEDQDGKTRLTLGHTGIPAGEMSDMTEAGWNESFDKLAETLAVELKPQ